MRFNTHDSIYFQLTNFIPLFLDDIITLKSKKRKIECDCMANCDNSNFFTQSIVSWIQEYLFFKKNV